jgi:hypothetical protein
MKGATFENAASFFANVPCKNLKLILNYFYCATLNNVFKCKGTFEELGLTTPSPPISGTMPLLSLDAIPKTIQFFAKDSKQNMPGSLPLRGILTQVGNPSKF